MTRTKGIVSNRTWAIVIGAGLTLSPIHNRWLTELVTVDGEVAVFLPALGTAIWLIATLLFATYNWSSISWGDKRVFIPLLIIVGAIGLSGITADVQGIGGRFAPLLMGVSLFALYMVSRVLGKDMFLPLAIGAAVASVGVIIQGIIAPGVVTGGLLFERNYDIVVGFVLLGTALFIHRHQWILASLALVAMFMSGSPEAVFALGFLGIAVLVRRDWSKKALIVLAPAVLAAVLLFSLGHGYGLIRYPLFILGQEVAAVSDEPLHDSGGTTPIGRKLAVAREAMADIKPLGDGYSVTAFTHETVHNVPLVIVQQLGWPGIVAALAWLWVSVWCLVKTRWKYVWVLILALSVFDHYTWTQLGPFWWAIIGASTATGAGGDLVFRVTHD